MNISRNDVSEVNAIVTISIDEADYAEKVDKALRDYRRRANIPGFRPGMAPLGMIKKMYGRGVKADELNRILQEAIFNYIRENDIDILGEPLPVDDQEPVDFDNDTTFNFKFELGIAPAYEPALNKKDNLKYYNITVTDEMVDKQVENYAARFGKYNDVDEAHGKDMIKGSMDQLDAEGNTLEGGIHVDEATMAADYIKDEEQKKLLDGAKKGAVIRFNPKKAYDSDIELSSMLRITKEQAAEMTSDFNLTVNNIVRYTPSEVNQELFDKVYGKDSVKSLEEFRTKVADGIRANYKEDSEYKLGIDAKALAIKKMGKLVFPEEFLRRWLLRTNEKMTEEQLNNDFPAMLDDLKWYIFKNRMAKSHDLKIEEDEIKTFARRMARMQFAQYGMTEVPDDILDNYTKEFTGKEETLRNISEKVLEEKVVNIMRDAAKLTETEISVDDFNKMFEA
ncbi:MAG: trigger factor [Paludibacteraceae bacterium]|nr:trigger factor [Paludibacteraceae bacterium]